MMDEAVIAAAKAMQAHPNWSKPGYVVTHEEIEADEQRNALEEAIDYFKAHDPDYLRLVVERLQAEGVRD